MVYLGLTIGSTYTDTTKQATYGMVLNKIEKKCSLLRSKYLNLFHKKQLINATVIPLVNHVVMSMGTDDEFCRKIDEKIVETLWQTESKGHRKQGRRLIAQNRLSMSCEMRGLDIPLVENIAHGLRCNFFGRMFNIIEIGDSKMLFVATLFERFLDQRQVDRIRVEVGGSQIYRLLADRSRRYSTFFSQVF